MNKKEQLFETVRLAFSSGIITKLVFSRPINSEVQKISGRMCAHRGKNILSLEYYLPGNTVSHKNVAECDLNSVIPGLISSYKQVNLITTLGEAEYKISKSGKEALLGTEKIERHISGATAPFEQDISSLDNRKNYILKGNEQFLISLGISDKNGRVHDKRQGKFRQINRFLEHIEGVYKNLPASGEVLLYDLCCGKSYLSFAVYYYLTEIKGRCVKLIGIDLKRDVIDWCSSLASTLGYSGMTFIYDDVKNTPKDISPDMVISLHACDIATDIVLDTAIMLRAGIILSTPCCHRYLSDKISCNNLTFVTRFPHLKNKLCEALTDSIRLARLEAHGYSVSAPELTDPDDTPKNTLIRAVRHGDGSQEAQERYEKILKYVLGENKNDYLKEIIQK